MRKAGNLLIVWICLMVFTSEKAIAQTDRIDSLFSNADTTGIIDSLLKDFDAYLDSLTKPKSFFNLSITAGTGIFNFESKNSVYLNPEKRLIISPTAAYYHKSGFGLSASGAMLRNESSFKPYQFVLSPSYDLVRKNFSTGIVYSKYINKDSLNFYTTPVSNELFAYFSFRKWKIRPALNISYGWGSRTDYEEVKFRMATILLQRTSGYYIIIKNEEKVSDLSLTFSLKRDFKWYGVIGKKDHVIVTPVALLNAGTQKYGFNTSYSNNISSFMRGSQNPDNSNFSGSTAFKIQSTSAALRLSYLVGKCIFQSQAFFDYYLPETDNHFNVFFSVTAGIAL